MQANDWGSLIDKLAAKLAVPAERLWAVLQRQAQIDAWLSLGWAVLLIGGTLVAVYMAHRRIQKQIAEHSYSDAEVVYIPLIVCGLLLLGLGGANLHDAIIAFANPEFVALQYILEAAK